MLRTLDLCETLEKTKLLDGKAYVKLLEVNPGLYRQDLTPESIILRSARVSTRNPITKGADADEKLIRFLWRNQHSSPFEQMSFTFEIHIPIFIRTHLFRHRTAKVNEESQRYTEVIPEFFDPLLFELRGNLGANKQKSTPIEISDEIRGALEKCNAEIEQIHRSYLNLLELGVAREIARSYLPVGTYTTFIYQMDLRNLLHFFKLRCGDGAQKECSEIAYAMLDLIRPICPITISEWEKEKNSVVLSEDEQNFVLKGIPFPSKSQEMEFSRKKEQYRELFEKLL